MDIFYDPAFWTVIIFLALLITKVPIAIAIGTASLVVAWKCDLGLPMTKYINGSRLEIHSDVPAAVNIDGECEYVNDAVFEIVPKAIKFVVPQFSEFHKGRAEREAARK